jgi:cardiolipin synthase
VTDSFLMRPPYLLLLWLLLGCASLTSCQLRLHKTLHHDQVAACQPRQVKVREWAEHLSLKFSLPGRDVSALASCAEVAPGDSQAGRLMLSYLDNAKFKSTWLKGTDLPVLGPEAWRGMITSLTHELAPTSTNQGSLLFLENAELVAYRETGGRAKLVPLESRPARVRIVHTYRELDLSRRLISLARKEMEAKNSGGILILTGQSPPMVYLNLKDGRLVFLHAPVAEPYEFSLLGLEKIQPTLTLRVAKAAFWSGSFLSMLNNPFSFVARGGNIALSITSKLIEWRPRTAPITVPPVANRPPMDLTTWEQYLDKITGTPPRLASVELLIDGDEFFPRYIQAVQTAERQIDTRLFIFDNDDYAVKLADLLRAKSNQGVKVRVMMDEMASILATQSDPLSPMPGNFTGPEHMENYLEKGSRVDVRPIANPWLAASHTKTFIIDGKRAWLGGMNFGREYRYDWHDLMIELQGPFVAQMEADFARFWAHAGPGGDLAWLKTKLFPPPDLTRNQPLPHGAIPVRPLYTRVLNHEIEQSQLQAMRHAQQRIWIEHAYLTDHRSIRELLAARRRGVDVRVILPEKNDSPIVGASHLVTISDLLQNGVRVYAYPGFTHVKAALYDGWACVGSANFDRFSLQANYEFNVGFSGIEQVKTLERRLFQTDFAKSREIHTLPEVPWSSYLADWLANEL